MDSKELYQACTHSDRTIQEEGYTALWQYLYRVALQVVYDQPSAEALAQDLAQDALIRVNGRLADCDTPVAFKSWSRRIVTNLAIDFLRRQNRLRPLPQDEETGLPNTDLKPTDKKLSEDELATLIIQSPISDRSRRVVLGRYFHNQPDELLAQAESDIAQRDVRPSHVQVTRAKNLKKLRNYAPLVTFLKET